MDIYPLKIFFYYIFAVLLLVKFTVTSKNSNTDWDLLIFTQQWPITTCDYWMEEDPSHTCNLPKIHTLWTIHGIWPTKFNEIGPSFCNTSAKFDLAKLQSIEETLAKFWPDIEAEENDLLWKHEWLKHGTCAALLAELDTELKYFALGLNWRQEYQIYEFLEKSTIVPGNSYSIYTIHDTLSKSLGKNPSIHCVYDHKNDISYISEIRLCFTKSFELCDCDGVKNDSLMSIHYDGKNLITNCDLKKPVKYPNAITTHYSAYPQTTFAVDARRTAYDIFILPM